MEAVSAVKMRKSQQVALQTRPYAVAAVRLLRELHRSASEEQKLLSPLLEKRPVGTTLLVVVTSDKGLAGPFNTNVIKKAESFIKKAGGAVDIAAVGKKASEYFSRRGRTPVASFSGFGDYAELEEVMPLFDLVHETFLSHKADEIYIVYTNFLSAMKQEVVVRKLLPFSEEGLEEMVKGIVPERGRFADTSNAIEDEIPSEFLFEPSPESIFKTMLPALLRIEIYHSILEANASEHSSRMVAMRNATDNAGELIKSYTVSLNKARQSAINKELAEITGGSEALNG